MKPITTEDDNTADRLLLIQYIGAIAAKKALKLLAERDFLFDEQRQKVRAEADELDLDITESRDRLEARMSKLAQDHLARMTELAG